MMTPRPPHCSRMGLLVAAVLVVTVACTRSGATPSPVPPSFTGTPPVAASAAPTPALGAASTGEPPSVASVAPSVAPSAAPSAAGTIAPSAAPSDPGTALATERPGPTPIVTSVKPAPEFVDLVQADGTPFTLADQHGHWTLLFFGYTHCPDVCPATLGELVGVIQAKPDVRVVFVSIDPERDTPEFLSEWTAYLPKSLIGVTGSPLAIRHAADSYGARYARVDTGSRAGYAMSHTAFQYLIDGDGNLLMTYPFGTPAAAILGDLDQLERAG